MNKRVWNSRVSRLGVVAALAAGAVSLGAMGQQADGPREARPQLAAPGASFIQQLSFADLVEEVSPAVVSIRTEAEVQATRRSMLPPEFERMLPPGFRMPDMGDDDGMGRRALGEGSGFFIDNQGHIVTNHHVIDNAVAITVVLDNGEEFDAELVGTDPSTDLAVLKVAPTNSQRFVRFAPEADLRVGDYVLAVGNPFGLGGSVTSGIVSAIGRENRGTTPYADFIQIDASINRGNSGGPTFDLRGNVVGVNTAIISPTGGNVGIGLAVPADVAQRVVSQLIEDGVVTRGWLGVQIGDLTDRLAEAVGLDSTDGALVSGVTEGSPAERAGFEEGDVVLEFAGTPIINSSGLTRRVGDIAPGKKVTAKVLREGRERTLRVTLARRDPFEARQATEGDPKSAPSAGQDEAKTMTMDLGVTFSSLTDALRQRYGVDEDVEGLVVADVERGSEAAEAGIREGMIVTRADNRPVTRPADIEKVVKAAKERGKKAVLIRVETPRAGASFLALPVDSEGEG